MKNTILVAAFALLLSACANGATTVVQPVTTAITAKTINVVQDDDTVTVDDEMSGYYGEKLAEYLYEDEAFAMGDEITVSYRFIQVNEGNRAVRYLVGFGAGKGSLTIESTFRDGEGNELAKIQSEGDISVGVFGGSFRTAIAKAAKETARFAMENFAATSE